VSPQLSAPSFQQKKGSLSAPVFEKAPDQYERPVWPRCTGLFLFRTRRLRAALNVEFHLVFSLLER
jgi:hypothetical protein